MNAKILPLTGDIRWIMNTLQRTKSMCDAHIKSLRLTNKQETLGLEKLALEQPAPLRNASRCANEGKGRCAGDKASRRSGLQQAPGQSQSSRPLQSTETKALEASSPPASKPSSSQVNSQDDLSHSPAPTPASAYVSAAHAIPTLLSSPQRLLLVLDLNGTLFYRTRASQNYTARPCLTMFLEYAFANHSLLVWSSAQPHNVKRLCTRLFSRGQREVLLGEWGRDTLELTSAQYKKDIQVYKRLDRIWGKESLQHWHPGFGGGERWGQHNTLLIDDSVLKASAQPFSHIEVPEFVRGGEKEGDGKDVLGQVVGYLEEARKWSDVSGFVRQRPFEIDAGWHWECQKKISQWRDRCEDDDDDDDDDDDGGVRL